MVTAINPALEALKFNAQVDDHLSKKVRNLLDRMDRVSKLYDDVIALSNEFNLRTNFDEKDKKVSFIDFTDSPDFKEIIDRLHEEKVLDGPVKYKFETKKEIDLFKAKLEGKQTELKNNNQKPMLLIEPLLKLLEQMNRIAKTILESNDRLIEKANSIR